MSTLRPPHPTLRADLSPKGEVFPAACGNLNLSLGGEVGWRSQTGEGAFAPYAIATAKPQVQ
ncbi:hypothetical protein [Pelagibacterium sp.]|uniref:hypothetical protein n=1 Tax=Pelagibacterium sp. TaxID=1967288 RepID=UPI003BACF750